MSADLWFSSPQPGTSQSCKTTHTRPMHHVLCLFTSELLLVSNYTARYQAIRQDWRSLPTVPRTVIQQGLGWQPMFTNSVHTQYRTITTPHQPNNINN